MSDGLLPEIAITERLAAFAASLSWDMLPETVIQRTQLLCADALANSIAGQELESSDALLAGLSRAGIAAGTLSVPGRTGGFSPYACAMLTAAAIHSLDFDDTHARAAIHPGAPVIAAAIAAAQLSHSGTRALITGIVAGYEVMARVSYGLQPQDHADRGFHLTATTGIFGAVAAAGSILGLTQAQISHAFGTALSRAAGSGQFLENGAWTKRYHVGAAAADGVLAVSLALEGFTGASRAFEGPRGFFNLYAPHPTPHRAADGLGVSWEILRTAVKPYPCCRAIHAPLDALFALLRNGEVPALNDIARVEVGMPRGCHTITGVPAERKRDPRNVVDCQFSAHLCIAAGIVNGRLAFSDYPQALTDQRVRDLLPLIDVVVDAEADAEYPEVFPGRVTFTTVSGETRTHYVRVPGGEPENMLTPNEFQVKFSGLVENVLGTAETGKLFEQMSSLHDDVSVSQLVKLAVPTVS